MEQAPTLGAEASNEDGAEEEERIHEEAIALVEKTLTDLSEQDPEAFEEAYRRMKRNTEMQ